MPADTFLGIQKVANGWVALPDGGGSDLTSVVQVFTTPDDLAGFVMGWALTSIGARPVADAPPVQAILTPGVIGPPTGPPAAEPPSPPPAQPQFVTDQPAVAQTAQPVLPPQQ